MVIDIAISILMFLSFCIVIIVAAVFGAQSIYEIYKAPRVMKNIHSLIGIYIIVFACFVAVSFFGYHTYLMGDLIVKEASIFEPFYK